MTNHWFIYPSDENRRSTYVFRIFINKDSCAFLYSKTPGSWLTTTHMCEDVTSKVPFVVDSIQSVPKRKKVTGDSNGGRSGRQSCKIGTVGDISGRNFYQGRKRNRCLLKKKKFSLSYHPLRSQLVVLTLVKTDTKHLRDRNFERRNT